MTDKQPETTDNKLPDAPPGKITIPAPEGMTGHVFVPDPDRWLTAREMATWLQRQVPPSLEGEPYIFVEAWARHFLCEFHIDGVTINDESMMDLESYPSAIAYLIVNETEALISQARNKKK